MWCKTSLRGEPCKKNGHCTLHPAYAAGAVVPTKAGTGGTTTGGGCACGGGGGCACPGNGLSTKPSRSTTWIPVLAVHITGHDNFGRADCTPVRRLLSVFGVFPRRLTVAFSPPPPGRGGARLVSGECLRRTTDRSCLRAVLRRPSVFLACTIIS